MDLAIKETERRREKQTEYNKIHGITPHTVSKIIRDLLPAELLKDEDIANRAASPVQIGKSIDIREIEQTMWLAVEELDFEKAAELRDLIAQLKGEAKSETSNKNYRRKTTQFKKHKRRNT